VSVGLDKVQNLSNSESAEMSRFNWNIVRKVRPENGR
jgi:hypothetical protein